MTQEAKDTIIYWLEDILAFPDRYYADKNDIEAIEKALLEVCDL